MKFEERMANEYFQSEGFNDIVYEPDGNVPPDFLINGTIAIEVTRLNEYVVVNGNPQPLEKLEFALVPRIKELLKSYSQCSYYRTALVNVRYGRPLKANKELIDQIRSVLDSHLKNIDEFRTYQINGSLSIQCYPSKRKLSSAYIMGIQDDNDTGGLVVSNIYKSLNVILIDKENKVKSYKARYSEWWLALIDRIGFGGLDEHDIRQLKEAMDIEHSFDRIVFISPGDSFVGIDLK